MNESFWSVSSSDSPEQKLDVPTSKEAIAHDKTTKKDKEIKQDPPLDITKDTSIPHLQSILKLSPSELDSNNSTFPQDDFDKFTTAREIDHPISIDELKSSPGLKHVSVHDDDSLQSISDDDDLMETASSVCGISSQEQISSKETIGNDAIDPDELDKRILLPIPEEIYDIPPNTLEQTPSVPTMDGLVTDDDDVLEKAGTMALSRRVYSPHELRSVIEELREEGDIIEQDSLKKEEEEEEEKRQRGYEIIHIFEEQHAISSSEWEKMKQKKLEAMEKRRRTQQGRATYHQIQQKRTQTKSQAKKLEPLKIERSEKTNKAQSSISSRIKPRGHSSNNPISSGNPSHSRVSIMGKKKSPLHSSISQASQASQSSNISTIMARKGQGVKPSTGVSKDNSTSKRLESIKHQSSLLQQRESHQHRNSRVPAFSSSKPQRRGQATVPKPFKLGSERPKDLSYSKAPSRSSHITSSSAYVASSSSSSSSAASSSIFKGNSNSSASSSSSSSSSPSSPRHQFPYSIMTISSLVPNEEYAGNDNQFTSSRSPRMTSYSPLEAVKRATRRVSVVEKAKRDELDLFAPHPDSDSIQSAFLEIIRSSRAHREQTETVIEDCRIDDGKVKMKTLLDLCDIVLDMGV
ncbi:hypothetical protein ADUPG1_010538 [Aduncisulcus paluster]|uniref:Uncharacterized protein n=1 Tax=Aduncisulcus paluster TaxID=2918883 RepID=A0ABQ5JU72_9EUKA|nr:hypothetical protein ADUPG1_010538 [Aduncisulcus paluster]